MESMQSRNVKSELAALDSKLRAFLPPQYQHCYGSVSPNSMGSAQLIYAPDGQVAWDQVWTTFCDLALAGGPPHRGKLLEPVSEADIAAEPARYGAVVREIGRAVALTTGLPVEPGYTKGWVGVRCGSLDEAAWLQFAVNAENVSARRRQAVLQIPAGPGFRVEKEIKNVVVALAKSYHYWDGHLTNSQQGLAGDGVWDAMTPAEAAANPSEYEAAMNQMEQGLRVGGLPIAPRAYTGWIGVAMPSEEAAVWMLRAVLVEQVLVRREGRFLYFPVNPAAKVGQTARLQRAAGQAFGLWTVLSEQGYDW